jgi:hypothetical protein
MNLSIYHGPDKIVWFAPQGTNLFKVKISGIQILSPSIVNYIVALYDDDYHYQTGKNYLIIHDYFYDCFVVTSNQLNSVDTTK